MAITRIGSATGTNTATMPAHQAGDLLLVFAYRDGNNTPPSLPSGWTNIQSPTGANTNSFRLGFRIATDSGTATGTWTNATSVIAAVYRGDGTIGIGASAPTGANGTGSPEYLGLTFTGTPTRSWVAGFAGYRNTSGGLQTPPPGMTNFANVLDATDQAVGHDTNGPVDSWSTSTAFEAIAFAGAFRTVTVEITETAPFEPPSGFNPSSIVGSKVVSWVDVSTAAMFQDTAGTVPATIGDPVGYISDGASATPYLRMGTENRPILRQYADGTLYLETTSSAVAGLQSVRPTTFGEFFVGAKIRRASVDTDMGPLIGVTGNSYPNAYWLGSALEFTYGHIGGYSHFGGSFNNSAFLPNEPFRDLGLIASHMPMAFPSSVQMGINASAQTRIDINGRQLSETTKTVPVVSQSFSSLWFLAPADGGVLRNIGHVEISRFYILNDEPTSTEEAELLEWLTWGTEGAPITGANPSTIMGDAVLSWFDVAQGAVSSDLVAMTPAALNDPVVAIADGTGAGYYSLSPSDLSTAPTMGDGCISFTGQALNQLMLRSGQVWIGMRRAYTSTFPSGTVQKHLSLSNDQNTWWGGQPLALDDNGFISSNPTHFSTDFNSFGEIGNLASGANIGVFFNDMFGFDAAGVPRASRNGVPVTGLTTQAAAPGRTSRIVSVGGVLDNRTVNAAESSDVDIVRLFILTEEPTPEQEAALLNWLENGDVGEEPVGGITIERGTPQSFENINNSTNITIPIGDAAEDRIILVVMSGEKGVPLALPTGATLGGNPMSLVVDGRFVSSFNDVTIIAVYAISVPSGTSDLTLNYSMADTAFSTMITPYRITGANFPTSGSVVMDANGTTGVTATVPDGGALISRVRQYGNSDRTILFNGVEVNTVENNNFYGSRRVYDSFELYPIGATVTVNETSTDFWAAAVAIPLTPASVTPTLGTLIKYWTGTAWGTGYLKYWSGSDWLPARLKRYDETGNFTNVE